MAAAFGIILLFFPFILVFCCFDRSRGFLWISFSTLAFGVLVALATQSIHIFSYPVVIAIYAAADLVVLVVFLCRKKSFRNWRPSVLAVLALCVILAELFSVHYHYTGAVQTANGVAAVENSSYPYPLFSDEWVEASVAAYSIHSRALPIVNPLQSDSPAVNLLVPFDSLLALLFLILGLSPTAGFAALAIGSGTALCLLFYRALRCAGLSRPASLVAVLAVPFLANGGNLPGIWFLLAYSAGLLAFLITLAALGKKDRALAAASAALSVILYPPMAVFAVPALVGGFLMEKKAPSKKIIGALSTLAVLAGLAVCLASLRSPAFFQAVMSGFFHKGLDGGIPSYAVWNVMPAVLLPLAFVGMYEVWRRKLWHIIAPAAVGLLSWAVYAFYENVIVIEYPRIVVIASFLLLFLAAAGIDLCLAFLARRWPFLAGQKAGTILASLVVVFFLAPAFFIHPFYPFGDSWQKLVLKIPDPGGAAVSYPAAPVNRYLVPDDLALFAGISGAVFIAPPWKGLVIGAATGNRPLETKSAVMTVSLLPYDDFISADCAQKSKLALQFDMAYAYSDPFDCAGFSPVGTSSEGLVLYRVDRG